MGLKSYLILTALLMCSIANTTETATHSEDDQVKIMDKKTVTEADHSHEHSHDHSHDHDHTHDHEHTHAVAEETNIHKLFAMRVGSLIGFHHVMNGLEVTVKELPPIGQGIFSTLFITIVPIMLIYLLNVMMSDKNRQAFVNVMLSFGLGGLLGDVFFHTLPHVMAGKEHSHSHDHGHGQNPVQTHDHGHDHGHSHEGGHAHSAESMYPSLIILVGIYTFFILEKIIDKCFTPAHNHSHS